MDPSEYGFPLVTGQHDRPAFSQAPPPYTASNESGEDAFSAHHGFSSAPSRFPATLNGYFQWKFTSTFHLGPSGDDKRFAVSTQTPFLRSKQTTILHAGPSDQDPPLACVEGDQSMRDRACPITIAGQPPGIEALHHATPYTRTPPTFAVDVRGPEKRPQREQFEWRTSRGNEVRQLTGHSVSGWKLVRLARTVGPGGDHRPHRAFGCASDGREVVAVLARNVSASMTKALKFQFLGSGLDGSMGETWEIMAVITALQLWYYDMLSATMASTTAAVST
ncbi:hypothetical protein P170DRAFT_435147 [Aspergillus steynii IBT 23096]|uniref:Uncharacterized protein n=1 Tax=Aspergillus steynii IBT 23096 TaxID=1392250 RepID=A0A2I2GL14_9EURO|nr:uncharacterized protein P170DRAFT_435147 [Aspergillus steynii IBT 23096]PLB53539.1 hypothetical protein P170DRAFT_435147 [Aspergillus steynii IBT 23096]